MNQKIVENVVKNLRRRKVSLKNYPFSVTRKVADKYYKCLNTPVALSCFLLLKYEEYDQLVTKSVKPADYDDGILFSQDYAAVKFLAKCANLPTSFDLEYESLKVEAWAEAKCKQTNLRIRKTFPSFITNRIRCVAQDILSDILGATPDFSEIALHYRFGPGATSATTRASTTIVDKLGQNFHTTAEAFADCQLMAQYVPGLASEFAESLDFVGPLCGPRIGDIFPFNEFLSVPKNAKTNRAIAKSVHLLTGGQLALGHILRTKLRQSRWGLDLDSLWQENQEYARIGSLGVHTDSFQYVTVDVTCASSTIAIETIFDLLPRSWALLLDRWRECRTLYGQYVHYNHKFSSMGNGFTFELESLLFFALAKASQIIAGDNRAFCSSFGDDIITTASSYDLLCEVFSFYGLTVNETKSYTSGYFRESCGADFWHGARINPPYLKDLLNDESSVVKLANRIRDYSSVLGYGYYCDVRFRPTWLCLVELLPSDTAYTFGPKHFGDTVVWCDRTDDQLSKPIYCSGQFYTRCISNEPNKRKRFRFENALGAWVFKHPASRESLKEPQIVIDLCGPIIGPYGTLYRNLTRYEVVVLPNTRRGKSGRYSAKVCSSSVMDYYPPWK